MQYFVFTSSSTEAGKTTAELTVVLDKSFGKTGNLQQSYRKSGVAASTLVTSQGLH